MCWAFCPPRLRILLLFPTHFSVQRIWSTRNCCNTLTNPRPILPFAVVPYILWFDGITNSVDMNLGKLWEIVRDRESLSAAVHGVEKSHIWLSEQCTSYQNSYKASPLTCNSTLCWKNFKGLLIIFAFKMIWLLIIQFTIVYNLSAIIVRFPEYVFISYSQRNPAKIF